MGAVGSLISLLVFAIIGGAPLTAATFVGRRMGYRGVALIAPWIAAVALGLLIGFGFSLLTAEVKQVSPDGGPDPVSMVLSSWIAALLMSGYFTTLVYLIVLAVRRLPSRPSDAVDVF